jgi:hypothetical protein
LIVEDAELDWALGQIAVLGALALVAGRRHRA